MHLKSEKPIGWNTRIVADDLYIEGTVVNAHSESGSFPFNSEYDSDSQESRSVRADVRGFNHSRRPGSQWDQHLGGRLQDR
jgi:hypothetical protein